MTAEPAARESPATAIESLAVSSPETLRRLEESGLVARQDKAWSGDHPHHRWRLTEAGIASALGFLGRIARGNTVTCERRERFSPQVEPSER